MFVCCESSHGKIRGDLGSCVDPFDYLFGAHEAEMKLLKFRCPRHWCQNERLSASAC